MDTIVVDGVAPASRRRRSYSSEEKRQLVAESYEPGASVSLVARRHDINANLLFTWRRQMRASTPAAPPLELIPIEIVGALPAPPVEVAEAEPRGMIEIILAGGVRVRVDAAVSEAALKRVLAAVKAAA
ncbi:MAG TPA: transposase [Caulobacteraceae bacterium]|nr:transposase [Caulobacteraceae bacterium]